MKIRKLEDRRSLEKPDRSNATWRQPRVKSDESLQQQIQANQKKLDEQRANGSSEAPDSKPRGKRSRKGVWRDSQDKPERRTPYWIVGILLIIPLSLLAFLLLNSKGKDAKPIALEEGTGSVSLEEEFSAVSLSPAQKENQLIEVATAFIASPTPEERLQYARDPERVSQLLSEFPKQALSELPIDSKMSIDAISADMAVQRIDTIFRDGSSRSLYLVRTEEGPKVDWEAYARHSNALQRWTAEAGDLNFQREPETSEVRVFLSIENYYNFRFSDDEVWMSYRISSPDLEDTVTAYARKGSTTAQILDEALGYEKKRVTLQLMSTIDDARNKQYQIEKVSALGWAKTEENFETSWLRTFRN